MADGYLTAAMAGLRAALVADAGVAALVADRVVDEPRENIAFPYIRFGRIAPVPDDTDGTLGMALTIGLECHSRPVAGRIEAARLCEAVADALHRQPEALSVAGFNVIEIEVQTWALDRLPDGAGYIGRLAFELRLDR